MPLIGLLLLFQIVMWFYILFDDGFTSKTKAILWFFACLIPTLPFIILGIQKISEID